MTKSKAISLLKSFNREEFKKFGLFICSPFYNKEKVQIEFYEILKKYYPEFDSPELEKEKIYSKMYPGRKYNDGAMRNIISDTLKLAEKFLAVNRFQSDKFKENVMILNELNSRKLGSHFLNQIEKIEKEINRIKIKNESFYEKKYELSKIHSSYLKETDTSLSLRNEILQETSDLVTINSLIKLLFYNTSMLNIQSDISNIKYRLNLSEEIDSFFKNKGKQFLEIPYIKSYYFSFKLIQTGEDKYFYKLKEFFKNNYSNIDKKEMLDIYTVLENYCYKKIRNGNNEFVKEQFLLYKQSVESGTYKGKKDFISSTFFMSIVVTGYEAEESQWVNHFVKNYISDVIEDSRKNTLHFCNALGLYHRNEYEKSLAELSLVTTEEFSFKQNIKSLMLKIYFALNEQEPFYSHIDTYKHFILRNKLVHDSLRKQINNYINFSKKLFEIKNSIETNIDYELENLKREIIKTQAMINKTWLLKMIDEINKTSLSR